MRSNGWRWGLAVLSLFWCIAAAWAETPAVEPPKRGQASRQEVVQAPLRQTADLAAVSGQSANHARVGSTSDPPVDFVPTSVAMYQAEIEARIMALEMNAAEERKGDKKDEKKPSDKKDGDKGWYEVGSDLGMTAAWKDGLELSTKNKDFRVHVGGRFQLDGSVFSVDNNLYTGPGGSANPPAPAQLRDNGIGNTYGNGVDVRRGRFRIDGTMYEQIDWACELDFFNSANIGGVTRTVTAPTDLWIQFKSLPIVQNVKIGNQKEAMGFEHMVSSRYLPFMERSYNQDTFYGGLYNGFTPGLTILGTYGDDEDGTYNVGIFQPTNNVFAFNSGIGDYSAVGRLTRLLYWDDEGRNLVHVGGSFRQATLVSNNIGGGALGNQRFEQYRTRDAVRAGLSGNWPTPANIILQGDNEQRANLEFVVVHRSWTFQSEYLVNVVHDARQVPFAAGLGTGSLAGFGPVQATTVYHGGYAQLMYFLTGESDHYSKKNGFFERVRPYENFFCVPTCNGHCAGWGAWQVGARYNYLCLNDGVNNGGILHNGTLGVN
ncbi:MAG: OprO/OprP family phosphate-selective porin [Pirellulales bacterium]